MFDPFGLSLYLLVAAAIIFLAVAVCFCLPLAYVAIQWYKEKREETARRAKRKGP